MQISIKNVTKVYTGGKKALNKANIELTSPALIGLVGPNGAGKTTFMKLLTLGLLPTEGQILLNGEPLLKQEKYLKSRLGYLPQEYGLYEELTVRQFLDYVAALKDIGTAGSEIEKVLGLCGLEERRKHRISTLSGGYKQRVGVAQALLGEPELIILDEPTVGLDPEERIRMRNMFVELARDRLMLLSTHIIDDIQSVCNRLIVLHLGNICYDGTPEGLLELSEGHVGAYECRAGERDYMEGERAYKVTAKVVMRDRTVYRIVADELPSFARPVPPSLEDAYMFAMAREEP